MSEILDNVITDEVGLDATSARRGINVIETRAPCCNGDILIVRYECASMNPLYNVWNMITNNLGVKCDIKIASSDEISTMKGTG